MIILLQCPHCSKKVIDENALWQHVKIKHGELAARPLKPEVVDDSMKPVFAAMKAADKARRHKNLAADDPTGWHQDTPYCWHRMLNGHRLDYWPTKNKFSYRGKIHIGDVNGFIAKRTLERIIG